MAKSLPNLLFLITDQQRADTLAPGSLCQMPNVNGLAATGTRFESCYAPNPICAPSRASMFTGLLPHNHGMVDNPHTVEAYRANLKENLPFWPVELQKAGYQTGYFGKWHVDRSLQLKDFGFGEYDTEQDAYRGYRAYRSRLGLPDKQPPPVNTVQVEQPGYRPFVLSGIRPEPVEATLEYYIYSRGIEFIEQQATQIATKSSESPPWALFLSTLAPHDPYIISSELFERYRGVHIPQPASFNDEMLNRPAIYRRIQQVWKGLEWEHFAQAIASYYAFCSLVDDQVGRVLEALRATGQAENTLIVYVSDHGDYMGDHRLMLKGIPAFDQAYRVPLILNGPGIPRGITIAQRVNHLDLAATILPLTSGESFACQGRSLVPLLKDQRGCSSNPVDGSSPRWSGSPHFAECHGQRFFYTQRILWWEQYKYVFNGFDLDEFYDLATDPDEMDNRVNDPQMRPTIEEMSARMWQVMHATNDFNMTEAEYPMFRFAPVGPQDPRSKTTQPDLRRLP